MAILTAARGLQTQKSALTRPDGSLSVADNVVIDFDNTIQKRRGFKEYSTAAFSAKPKQLFTYRSRILAHYATTLSFDSTGAGVFSDFSTPVSELISGMRMKAVEANGNLYFTTVDGIKKISAKTAADLSTSQITSAGGIEAIDLSGTVVPDDAGFLPPQSKVAYRLIFGTKDANSNLITGSPSSRLVLANNSKEVKQSEVFTINVLDYTTVGSSEYFLFDLATTKYVVYFNTTGSDRAPLTADTIDREAIEIKTAGTFSNDSLAAAIANELSASITGITIEISGPEIQVTVTDAGDVPDAAQGNLATTTIKITKVFDGSITTGASATANLTSILPSAITTDYFYQLYRTAVTTVGLSENINDIEPGDEQYFVFESPITAADIAAGMITIQDNTPEVFRESGAYLYTNATTGTGILSANEKPPVAADVALFRNSTFYANTKDTHRLTFNILSVDNFISGATKFVVGKANKARTYTFVGAPEVTDITVAKKSLTTGNSYLELSSANNERRYYFWFDKGILSHSFDSVTAVDINQINVANHGYATNDVLVFSGAVPGGLVAGTTYYAKRIDANFFSVTATANGSVITLSDTSGTCTVTHTPANPSLTGKLGVRLPLELFDDTDAESKSAFISALNSTGDFYSVDFSSNVVRVTCSDAGDANAPSLAPINPGWTFSVVTNGTGEDKTTRQVLLSTNSSVGEAIDLTARSLVRVINYDSLSPVTAQYLTGSDDLPGKILLKSKSGEDVSYYIGVNDASLLGEFSPELAQVTTLNSYTSGTNVFQTSTAHGFIVGDSVYIHDNTNGTPLVYSGVFEVSQVVSPTTFKLKDQVVLSTNVAISGVAFKTTTASDNNKGPNRIYFSKTLQPEAVPLPNYIDVGSKDKSILRILPLRDNLFVLKEDGIYIVTGDVAPNFSVRLLDTSATLIAPDSAVVLNNLIYCLTTQGVVSVSETGVSIISRDIEDQIKKVTTFAYSYKYSSFGVAYESDRSYLLWLPTLKSDTIATQCFRYNSITNTWTRWVMTNTCGLVVQSDDRMYLGKGDRFYVAQERKSGTREDLSDRDFIRTIGSNSVNGTSITLSSSTDVAAGDVLVQEQYVTVPKLNRLLKKLDKDLNVTASDYFATLQVTNGSNLANQLEQLVDKLNADPALFGSFSIPTGSNNKFQLQIDYNDIVDGLNNISSGTFFKTYSRVTDLIKYEVLIEEVIAAKNTAITNFQTWFIQGDVIIYKAYACEVQWAPQHFGKPDVTKQIPDGTLMFEEGTIYSASISYSSDRSASFTEIPFKMQGPGFWASYPWADSVWGGGGNAVPLRTLIPADKSRCRYINVKFKHQNARESFKLLGITLEPRDVSTRGYR